MIIREEEPDDIIAIHRINTSAFDTEAEANLVDALRAQDAVIISLVAAQKGVPVGHIPFSPVTLSPPSNLKLAGLARWLFCPNTRTRVSARH